MATMHALGSGARLLRSVAVLATAGATAAISFTGAVFTDSDDVNVAGITTGSIDLASSSGTIDFSLSNMAPGDLATVQQLTITNSGSLELRYALDSVTSEDALASVLDLDVWVETQEAGSDGTCDDVVPGAYLYQGALGSVAGSTLFGDATQGADVGDRVLAAAANEVLCFDVSLPLSAGNAVQALTTTATLTFASEQTKNNP